MDHPNTWTQFEADAAAAMFGAVKKSGWYEEAGGWRFYLGDTGAYVVNNWYPDGDNWYWFDGAGMMVTNVWYEYKRYYFNDSAIGMKGALLISTTTPDGYQVDENGVWNQM